MTPPRFWSPTFDIERRDDGTILMRQSEPLENHFPTLADYLDHWAEAAPDRTWLARRQNGEDWVGVTYAEARQTARRIGAALLELKLGPERPLLILSENSLEHGLLALACSWVGIPYAPVSPAYSLVSKDHGKLRDIAETLNPGAVFADDGAAFSAALDAVAAPDRVVLNARHPVEGALLYDDLRSVSEAPAEAARAALTAETVVKYLFTSGSTGSPKAVINTNGMMTAMAAMTRDCYRFLEDEPPVVLDWAPWNHTAAGNKVSALVLTNGGTYYIDDGRPVPGKFDETIRNLRDIACTWYFNVPLGYDMLVEALETDRALRDTFFSRLSMMFYAGAGMAQHTWDRLIVTGARSNRARGPACDGPWLDRDRALCAGLHRTAEEGGQRGRPVSRADPEAGPRGRQAGSQAEGPDDDAGLPGRSRKDGRGFRRRGVLLPR